MNNYNRISIPVLLMLMISIGACGHGNMVVLMPDLNGSVGKISVSNASGSVDIDTASQSTTIKSKSSAPSNPIIISKEKIDELFGEALAIQPSPPVHFILYFTANSTHLLPESNKVLQEITTAIRRQAARHISVVGYSDTKGDKADNLKLSTQRAVSIKNRLVESGVAVTTIEATSHGEENLLIKTADNIANAKNRRVEVVIF